jgi:PKD repeat protein
VNFNASASSDPDAGDSIASYTWNFGDGTTASGVSVNKTYNSAGTFTAVLTVKDTRGASSTSQVTLIVGANSATTLKVSSITLTSALNRTGSKMVQATVKVTTLNNVAVSGATVTGTWSGLISGSSSASTGTNGDANLVSKSFRSSGNVTFKVTGVSKTGSIYDASQSVTTKSGTF